jgi:hypothetical protein
MCLWAADGAVSVMAQSSHLPCPEKTPVTDSCAVGRRLLLLSQPPALQPAPDVVTHPCQGSNLRQLTLRKSGVTDMQM